MTVDSSTRLEPKTTLQDIDVHSVWSRQFRGDENRAFYSLAFNHIAHLFGDPTESPVLDAGCGSGTKSVALARRGYYVQAIDFSDVVLDQAKAQAASQGLDQYIAFGQGDLTALTIASDSIRRAVCWGVLMHIPNISAAVAELARVMAPNGLLVVSEGNVRSLQSVFLRTVKRILGRERAEIIRTAAGLEFWEQTEAGSLMTRQADIPWLIQEFRRNQMEMVERGAGQFTEIYVLLRWKPIRRIVHAFNNLWFRFPRWAGPAYGNLIVFRKTT